MTVAVAAGILVEGFRSCWLLNLTNLSTASRSLEAGSGGQGPWHAGARIPTQCDICLQNPGMRSADFGPFISSCKGKFPVNLYTPSPLQQAPRGLQNHGYGEAQSCHLIWHKDILRMSLTIAGAMVEISTPTTTMMPKVMVMMVTVKDI